MPPGNCAPPEAAYVFPASNCLHDAASGSPPSAVKPPKSDHQQGLANLFFSILLTNQKCCGILAAIVE